MLSRTCQNSVLQIAISRVLADHVLTNKPADCALRSMLMSVIGNISSLFYSCMLLATTWHHVAEIKCGTQPDVHHVMKGRRLALQAFS